MALTLHRRSGKMIAINLADIVTADPITSYLVAPVIQGRKTVEVQPGRVDGVAVVLECEDERARADLGPLTDEQLEVVMLSVLFGIKAAIEFGALALSLEQGGE